MNKIAVYLNEHLLGEVSSAKSLRRKYANDASILTVVPEIITFPRITNDIRKITRFTWQLAEKGHVVGVTARGFGGDTTGAAIGKGVIVDTSRHLTRIIEVATKERLVHVQPGVSLYAVNQTLKWQGLALKTAPRHHLKSVSVGGAISSDLLGANGAVSDSVQKLEVVLANGDVMETGRMSRRDVSKKLGLQTLEGEIYRRVEGLLEDNEELIAQMAADTTRDNVGYKRIAEVRAKDGSFDLTPLFIGSQGTLGIISEAVLATDFYSDTSTHVVMSVDSMSTARDVADRILEIEPDELLTVDGEVYRRAAKSGARFAVLGEIDQLGAVVYVRFADINDRTQQHKLKKLRKLFAKTDFGVVDSTDRDNEEFLAVAQVSQQLAVGTSEDNVSLPVLSGAFIPADRREEFEGALTELGTKHRTALPFELNVLTGIYDIFPLLKLGSVSDKQQLFKILADFAAIVDHCNGTVSGDGGEGRIKTNTAWSTLDERYAKLYEEVRAIFDPFGTLNPGVKQKLDMRTLVAALNTEYTSASVL